MSQIVWGDPRRFESKDGKAVFGMKRDDVSQSSSQDQPSLTPEMVNFVRELHSASENKAGRKGDHTQDVSSHPILGYSSEGKGLSALEGATTPSYSNPLAVQEVNPFQKLENPFSITPGSAVLLRAIFRLILSGRVTVPGNSAVAATETAVNLEQSPFCVLSPTIKLISPTTEPNINIILAGPALFPTGSQLDSFSITVVEDVDWVSSPKSTIGLYCNNTYPFDITVDYRLFIIQGLV